MDNAAGVRRRQRIGNLNPVPQCLAEPHPLSRDAVGEGLAGHELHHEELGPVCRGKVVNRDNIRVVQRRRCACLTEEPAFSLFVQELLGR